jgi:hypothetical protein
MTTIERAAQPSAARHEQAQAAQRRQGCGVAWMSPFRGDSTADVHGRPAPDDVARSEVFYNSTCCWI